MVALLAVAMILMPPLVGMAEIGSAQSRAFGAVSAHATLPHETLSGDVGRALRLTMFGVAVSGAGLVLLVFAMVRRAQLQRQSTRCA